MKKPRNWLQYRRRFPPTREGWWFLGATLLVGVAALNGGINLLFMVFGMMISLIIASGLLSELCLRSLTVVRRPPLSVHAGAPFLMGIAVRNDKRRAATFSLEVEDLLDGKPVDRRCYYLKLPAGRLQETAYKHTLPRRGVWRFTGFRLSTRFPFGFIRKSRDVEAPLELVVFPALVPVPEALVQAGLAELGRRQKPSRSRSGDFHGLREFRPDDDPRDIHWRTSARRGRPFVRESEEETGMSVLVTFDNHATADGADGEAFEASVSMAASIVVALLRRGLHVGLRTTDVAIPPAPGASQAQHLLRALALVAPRPGQALARVPVAAATASVVRVTPGSPTPRFESAPRAGLRKTA